MSVYMLVNVCTMIVQNDDAQGGQMPPYPLYIYMYMCVCIYIYIYIYINFKNLLFFFL